MKNILNWNSFFQPTLQHSIYPLFLPTWWCTFFFDYLMYLTKPTLNNSIYFNVYQVFFVEPAGLASLLTTDGSESNVLLLNVKNNLLWKIHVIHNAQFLIPTDPYTIQKKEEYYAQAPISFNNMGYSKILLSSIKILRTVIFCICPYVRRA